MSQPIITSFLGVLLCVNLMSCTRADPTSQARSTLTGRLDYRASLEVDSGSVAEQQANLFFEALVNHYGETVRLELTLITRLNQKPFELSELLLGVPYKQEINPCAEPYSPQPESIGFELVLQHPAHYHDPMTLIGRGKLLCREVNAEGSETPAYLELSLTEDVIVLHQFVPTAREHLLFSVQPPQPRSTPRVR